MNPWLFWGFEAGVLVVSMAAGALSMYLYLRRWIERIRDRDWDAAYDQGWAEHAQRVGTMIPDETRLVRVAEVTDMTEDGRAALLAELTDSAIDVIRADFNAIRAHLKQLPGAAVGDDECWADLQLAHDRWPGAV